MPSTSSTSPRALIFVENEYQDLEVWYPLLRLREAGYRVVTAGTKTGPSYKGRHGYPITADALASELVDASFDVVVVPGGIAPDKLRLDPAVLAMVRKADAEGRTLGAICHAGSVLVSANVLRGRRATSYVSIRDDMVNAGCTWVDEEVVVDRNLVTSRVPADLPAFMRALLEVDAARRRA